MPPSAARPSAQPPPTRHEALRFTAVVVLLGLVYIISNGGTCSTSTDVAEREARSGEAGGYEAGAGAMGAGVGAGAGGESDGDMGGSGSGMNPVPATGSLASSEGAAGVMSQTPRGKTSNASATEYDFILQVAPMRSASTFQFMLTCILTNMA